MKYKKEPNNQSLLKDAMIDAAFMAWLLSGKNPNKIPFADMKRVNKEPDDFETCPGCPECSDSSAPPKTQLDEENAFQEGNPINRAFLWVANVTRDNQNPDTIQIQRQAGYFDRYWVTLTWEGEKIVQTPKRATTKVAKKAVKKANLKVAQVKRKREDLVIEADVTPGYTRTLGDTWRIPPFTPGTHNIANMDAVQEG